jgi:hypothetical protein
MEDYLFSEIPKLKYIGDTKDIKEVYYCKTCGVPTKCYLNKSKNNNPFEIEFFCLKCYEIIHNMIMKEKHYYLSLKKFHKKAN